MMPGKTGPRVRAPEPVQPVCIDDLVGGYAVLLLDAYGVLVNPEGALPGAVELIEELNHSGKPYFVITNDASRLPETAAERYRSFGLALDARHIITAGSLLPAYFARRGLVGQRCVVLGPEGSVRYVEMAGGRVVSPGEPFEVLVIGDETGFPFIDTLDAVLTVLIAKLDREEPVELVLPNPDLVYPKANGGFGITSGSIALLLEAALRARYPNRAALTFARLGKPHTAIFAEAERRAGTRSMVMIGDQLETDIRGANAFGIDSALIAGGVGLPKQIGPIGEGRPTYTLESLTLARGHSR